MASHHAKGLFNPNPMSKKMNPRACTVTPYWVMPAYVELIRAVWADDGDRPLLF
jgi:hypothetical protein